MNLSFEKCLEMLLNGKNVLVKFLDNDFIYFGIKNNYCFMCLEGREEKCKIENLREFFDYLSNEEGFEDEEIGKIEEVGKKEFLDILEFFGENIFREKKFN